MKKKQQHKVVKHKVVKRHHPRARKKPKAVAVAQKTPRVGPPLRVAGASTERSSNSLALLLGVALGLSLIVMVVAVRPPAMLPSQIVEPVYENREAIIFGAVATAISIALGLAIALFGS